MICILQTYCMNMKDLYCCNLRIATKEPIIVHGPMFVSLFADCLGDRREPCTLHGLMSLVASEKTGFPALGMGPKLVGLAWPLPDNRALHFAWQPQR